MDKEELIVGPFTFRQFFYIAGALFFFFILGNYINHNITRIGFIVVLIYVVRAFKNYKPVRITKSYLEQRRYKYKTKEDFNIWILDQIEYRENMPKIISAQNMIVDPIVEEEIILLKKYLYEKR